MLTFYHFRIINFIISNSRTVPLVDSNKVFQKLETMEKVKKEFSKSYFVECATHYNAEEWNKKFDSYIMEEWQRVFGSRPFDSAKIGELFAKNTGVVTIDFQKTDFRDENGGTLDISLFHLDGVNFSEAKFGTLRAHSARLTAADFSYAEIDAALISAADFTACNFNYTEMPNAVLEWVNLRNSSFRNSNLSNSRLTNCDLSGAEFFETNILGADFTLSIVDGRTLLNNVKVNNKTNFAGVGLNLCRIYPPTIQRDIENNILHLDETNKDVFVAMPFNYPLLDSALENAIQPACHELNLIALPVKDKPYTGSIPNEIKKSIAQSRLVIAELTYRNMGVYYEVGYAEGKNVPVIYTCNKGWFDKEEHAVHEWRKEMGRKKASETSSEIPENEEQKYPAPVHFDILQDKIIFWDTEEELKEKLVREIKGVI